MWFTRNDGLSRLYLDRYLGLNSGNRYLASSNSDGRVALVGGEAAGANFSAKLRTHVDKAKSELQRRSAVAVNIIDEAERVAYELFSKK